MRPKKSKINNTIIEEKGYKATQSAPTEGYRKLLKCLCRTITLEKTYIHTCNLLSVTKGILVVKAFLMNLINVFCSVFASIG